MRFNLCMPAVVYLVLAIIGTLLEFERKKKRLNGPGIAGLVANFLIIGLITYLLDYICKKYSTRYAWYALALLIFLPLILALTFFIAFMIIR